MAHIQDKRDRIERDIIHKQMHIDDVRKMYNVAEGYDKAQLLHQKLTLEIELRELNTQLKELR